MASANHMPPYSLPPEAISYGTLPWVLRTETRESQTLLGLCFSQALQQQMEASRGVRPSTGPLLKWGKGGAVLTHPGPGSTHH